MEYNYEQDLTIDKNRLDDEWLKIAQDLWRYGKLLGQAIYDHERAKQSLDVVRAQLDASIRHEFNSATPPVKFTEAVVDGRIRTTPTYLEAQEKLFQASKAMSMHQQAVYAFQAKKAALENLVKLLQSNYWAEPRAPVSKPANDEPYHQAMQQALPAEVLTRPAAGSEPTAGPSLAPRPKPSVWAVGPEPGPLYTQGPFNLLEQAAASIGWPGDFIFEIPDGAPPRPVMFWSAEAANWQPVPKTASEVLAMPTSKSEGGEPQKQALRRPQPIRRP